MANDMHWVGTWATAPAPAEGAAFSNQTLRMNARVSIGGRTLRVRLSNAYGTRPLAVGAAHIGLRASGAGIVPGSDRILTFGGEHSAHYYFRDFWRADTGMLAAMHVLAALGEQDGTLAELTAEYTRYSASGEINSTVADQSARMAAVRAAFADRATSVDELDGLTIELDDGA